MPSRDGVICTARRIAYLLAPVISTKSCSWAAAPSHGAAFGAPTSAMAGTSFTSSWGRRTALGEELMSQLKLNRRLQHGFDCRDARARQLKLQNVDMEVFNQEKGGGILWLCCDAQSIDPKNRPRRQVGLRGCFLPLVSVFASWSPHHRFRFITEFHPRIQPVGA
jgi:hypothetical protein